MESHLLQMRGLKPVITVSSPVTISSHLLQMRGLKPLFDKGLSATRIEVASFTDAWIETEYPSLFPMQLRVASFTDAWIET